MSNRLMSCLSMCTSMESSCGPAPPLNLPSSDATSTLLHASKLKYTQVRASSHHCANSKANSAAAFLQTHARHTERQTSRSEPFSLLSSLFSLLSSLFSLLSSLFSLLSSLFSLLPSLFSLLSSLFSLLSSPFSLLPSLFSLLSSLFSLLSSPFSLLPSPFSLLSSLFSLLPSLFSPPFSPLHSFLCCSSSSPCRIGFTMGTAVHFSAPLLSSPLPSSPFLSLALRFSPSLFFFLFRSHLSSPYIHAALPLKTKRPSARDGLWPFKSI